MRFPLTIYRIAKAKRHILTTHAPTGTSLVGLSTLIK
jgi:hypothetical protein